MFCVLYVHWLMSQVAQEEVKIRCIKKGGLLYLSTPTRNKKGNMLGNIYIFFHEYMD